MSIRKWFFLLKASLSQLPSSQSQCWKQSNGDLVKWWHDMMTWWHEASQTIDRMYGIFILGVSPLQYYLSGYWKASIRTGPLEQLDSVWCCSCPEIPYFDISEWPGPSTEKNLLLQILLEHWGYTFPRQSAGQALKRMKTQNIKTV